MIDGVSRRETGVVAALALSALVLLPLFVSATPVAAQQQSSGGPDVTVYRIHVHSDGNATWTVELRRELRSPEEVEGFRSFMSEYRSGNLTIFEGIESQMRPLVNEAENETNRSMSALNFDRDVRVSDTVTGKVGITRVSFNWTNFAYRKDGNLVMGDVFVGSGLTIGSNEKLVVEYDRNLSLETVAPQPDTRDSNSLQWTGQRFFEAGHPRVVLSLPDAASVGIPPFVISVVAGVVVLISGFFGGVYIGRRFGIINGGNASASESEADGGSVETEDELLTDEDRIVNLLRENEGRMKQADIVESTGWSKSKVSMVLSDMEDDGKISKLRLGRENVIDLADGDGEE